MHYIDEKFLNLEDFYIDHSLWSQSLWAWNYTGDVA